MAINSESSIPLNSFESMILPSSQLQFVVVSVLLLGPGLVHGLPFHYGLFPVAWIE